MEVKLIKCKTCKNRDSCEYNRLVKEWLRAKGYPYLPPFLSEMTGLSKSVFEKGAEVGCYKEVIDGMKEK